MPADRAGARRRRQAALAGTGAAVALAALAAVAATRRRPAAAGQPPRALAAAAAGVAADGWRVPTRRLAAPGPAGRPASARSAPDADGAVRQLAVIDGGLVLASAATPADGPVARLWDVATGRLVATYAGRGDWAFRHAAVTPDGELALTAAGAGDVPGAVRGSPGGTALYGAGRALAWRPRTGAVVRAFAPLASPGAPSGTWKTALSADGRTAVTAGGGDATVAVWDVATGALRRRVPARGPGDGVMALAADGATLVTADAVGGEVCRVPLGGPGRERCVELADDHVAGLLTALSPDGRLVADGSPYGMVVLFDAATGRRLGDGLVIDSAAAAGAAAAADTVPVPITALAFSRDGARLAAAQADGRIAVFATRPWRRIATLRALPPGPWPPADDAPRVAQVAFMPDGRRLVAAAGRELAVFDGVP
jgi:WD40 repeat protein